MVRGVDPLLETGEDKRKIKTTPTYCALTECSDNEVSSHQVLYKNFKKLLRIVCWW